METFDEVLDSVEANLASAAFEALYKQYLLFYNALAALSIEPIENPLTRKEWFDVLASGSQIDY